METIKRNSAERYDDIMLITKIKRLVAESFDIKLTDKNISLNLNTIVTTLSVNNIDLAKKEFTDFLHEQKKYSRNHTGKLVIISERKKLRSFENVVVYILWIISWIVMMRPFIITLFVPHLAVFI